MFIDYSRIEAKAGKGGNGIISFRREKFVPKGGPNGGNGGHGGSVILQGDSNSNTLLNFRFSKLYRAEKGVNGLGNNMTGACGADRIVLVPLGTEVFDITDENDRLKLGDITEQGQQIKVAIGGAGGRGNTSFANSTNQAPRFCTPGKDGEDNRIELILKLMADVGLVGFPNAGKSTLLSSISAARPKIANYEFTTLEPSLGVVQASDFETFVMADIPGLIEGAANGKGLGIQFLKHIQRTKVLLFLIDINDIDPYEQYQVLRKELHQHDPMMDKKPHLIVLSKLDTLPQDEVEDVIKMFTSEFNDKLREEIISISSVANKNLDILKRKLFNIIKEEDSL